MSDVDLGSLLLYLGIGGASVQAIYQMAKLLRGKYRKGDESEAAEPAEQPRRRKPMDPWDTLVPVALGLGYVLAMSPYTVFGFLPFAPSHIWLDRLFSAVLVSRSANLSHETIRDVGTLVEGLIGRITRGIV